MTKQKEELFAPDWYLTLEPKLLEALQKAEEAKAEYDHLRETIKNLMDNEGLTKIGTDLSIASRTPDTQQTSIDKKKLMSDFPIAYEATMQTRPIKGSVRITLSKHQK